MLGLTGPASATTTITSVSDSPDPATVGQTVTFTVNWTNTGTDLPVRAVICKTNAISGNSTPSCPGGAWAIGGTSSTSPSTASYTPVQADVGTKTYYVFACGQNSCAGPQVGTFTVNNVTPTISSASDSPDPVTRGSNVTFSVSWSDAGDTNKAVICKTNAVAAGTCPGGAWATGSLSSSPSTASYTTTQLDVGTNNYWAFACDSGNACSGAIAGTFTVNNATPGITSATDSPDPATAGDTVTFSVGWSDMGDSVKALICKTNAVSSGTCPGGAWATGLPTTSSPATATYGTTAFDVGTHSYYAFACDTANLCSGAISGTFTVVAGYFSDHCSGAGSTSVVEGYAGDVFVRLRTLPTGTTGLWACVAVDGGGVHVGGKAVVSAAVPGNLVDNNVAACVGDPGDLVNRQGTIGSGEPYNVHVIVRPTEVWVCVRATNAVAVRLVIPVSALPTATFLPDPTAPHAPAPKAPTNPARPSSACQQASSGVTRFLNLGALGTHAWLYGWQQSATRAHVCVRAEGATAAGGRLTVDANGGVTFVTTGTDFTPCTENIITDGGTPPFSIRISDPGDGLPVSVCVKVDSTQLRITVTAGSQGIVTWTPDS